MNEQYQSNKDFCILMCCTAWGKFKKLLPILTPSQFMGRCLPPVSALLFFMEAKLWCTKGVETLFFCSSTNILCSSTKSNLHIYAMLQDDLITMIKSCCDWLNDEVYGVPKGWKVFFLLQHKTSCSSPNFLCPSMKFVL